MIDAPFCIPSDGKTVGLISYEKRFADEGECRGAKRPYLMALDNVNGRVLLTRPSCGLWSCDVCGRRNTARWAKRIHDGIVHYMGQGDKFFMVTLTTHEAIKTFARHISVWRSGWKKLYLRMKRLVGKGLHYVLLPELSPVGRLHAHMLVNHDFGAVPVKNKPDKLRSDWLKKNARESGLGYMVDVRPVDNAALGAFYVTKYCTKSLSVTGWPSSFHRVRPSHHWPELVEDKPGVEYEWKVVMQDRIGAEIERSWSAGWDVLDIRTGALIEVVDIE